MRLSVLALVLSAVVGLMGCGSDGNAATGGSGGSAGSGGAGGSGGSSGFDELYDQGLTKYVGEFAPAGEPTFDEANGIDTYQFAVPDDPSAEPRGPLCLRGTEFTVDTREGSSDELVIFLQGGGACWEDFCAAFEETNSLPPAGILNPELVGNPVADWDVLYLPYCDGSLFAGDVDRVLPASELVEGGPEESMGYQRGLQNLTAALDVGLAEFPNPSRILLTGISGGAFGTIAALPLVRYYYPDTEILVFNDSGVGVAKDGNPDFINETLLAGWNASSSLVPESCPDCTSNGHATRLIEWQLAEDDNFTMSALSFSADAVISFTFLMVNPANFTTWLLAETGRTTGLFEDRYKRFIPSGTAHTTLLREVSEGGNGIQIGALDTEIDGVTVLDWFTAMIEGTEAWDDLVDESLE